MVCPSCGSDIREPAAFCSQCGVAVPKRGSTAKRILKWVGIGFGGLLGLFIVMVIVVALTTETPSPQEQETPDTGLSSGTPSEAFTAGIESGQYLRVAGRELDDDFVQEAMSRVESKAYGDPEKWVVSNSDVVAVCDVYSRLGDARARGADLALTEFEDILGNELGLKRSTLMGVIQAGTDDSSGAVFDLCEPIDAYGVGFNAAYEVTITEIYGFNLSESDASAQLDSTIDRLSRAELRIDKKTAYDRGFLAGMDAANIEFDRRQTALSDQPSAIPSTSTPKPFGDGIWKIGEEIALGTYAAPGGEQCLWNSLTGFTGSAINDIARLSHPGRPVVTIGTKYQGFQLVGFQSLGCGEWRPIADITGPVDSITDGTWLVAQEILPGTYQASNNCYWSRLRGFNGEFDDVIVGSDLVEENPTVTIEPTDAGFMSFGCNGWARVE